MTFKKCLMTLLLILTFTVACIAKTPPATPPAEQIQQSQCTCPGVTFQKPILIGIDIFTKVVGTMLWCYDNKFIDKLPDIEGQYLQDLSACTCLNLTQEQLKNFILVSEDIARQLSEGLVECKNKVELETPIQKSHRECLEKPFQEVNGQCRILDASTFYAQPTRS